MSSRYCSHSAGISVLIHDGSARSRRVAPLAFFCFRAIGCPLEAGMCLIAEKMAAPRKFSVELPASSCGIGSLSCYPRARARRLYFPRSAASCLRVSSLPLMRLRAFRGTSSYRLQFVHAGQPCFQVTETVAVASRLPQQPLLATPSFTQRVSFIRADSLRAAHRFAARTSLRRLARVFQPRWFPPSVRHVRGLRGIRISGAPGPVNAIFTAASSAFVVLPPIFREFQSLFITSRARIIFRR